MVHLNRITTRTGDDGTTSLGDGTHLPKTDPRVAAIGSVDELNAAIGVALACDNLLPDLGQHLTQIQHDLFDAGAELCMPSIAANTSEDESALQITAAHVQRLDQCIEHAVAKLEPLTNFILPGGSPLAAQLHMARTICRRAERDVLTLADSEPVGAMLRQYLNRLSDLLFVSARLANDGGRADVLWQQASGARQLPDDSQ